MEKYFFEHSGLSFDKDPDDINKYIVVACAKNEGDYIVEWVEHYLNLGFDKVVIADNNDVGDDSLPTILKDYVDNNRVQIFDFRGVNYFQVGFYSDFCAESNFKWCAFYDCDEFLEIAPYTNIKYYLDRYEGWDVLLLNWLVFGPNNQIKKTEGTVQERFKYPQSPVLYFKENSFVKSLVRGDKNKFAGCFFNGSHVPVPAEGKRFSILVGGEYVPSVSSHAYFMPRYKNGYIKHYYTKSFEEWVSKASRGWPDGTENLQLSKYLIFRNEYLPPISFMRDALFKVDDYSGYKNFHCALDDYDVISIRNSGEFAYPMFTEVMDMFENVTDHTFIFSDDTVDDALYAILLEYGYRTGNRVMFCKNSDEMWNAYLTYHKKNSTYYVISFT